MTNILTDEARPLALRGLDLGKTHVICLHRYQRELFLYIFQKQKQIKNSPPATQTRQNHNRNILKTPIFPLNNASNAPFSHLRPEWVVVANVCETLSPICIRLRAAVAPVRPWGRVLRHRYLGHLRAICLSRRQSIRGYEPFRCGIVIVGCREAGGIFHN